ncbi:MAG: SDR family NAD(P)-dependent oxidoreductase [Pontixanthobacter sp.]
MTTLSPFDFSGRSALVTGAASGIGASCVRALDRGGAGKLILVDVDEVGLNALDLQCSDVVLVSGSVADAELWTRIAADLAGIDHAVINAGIGGSGEIADLDLAEWRRVMAVNLDGAFLTLSAALKAMKSSGGGSAVVTASITGIKPVPGIGPYGVAKAGVAHMARIAAAENAKHNIRVNAIAPGGVDTAIWEGGEDFLKSVEENGRAATLKAMAKTTPRGQFATADELAGEIAFLLSDMAANITGTVLVSDGGYSF